MLKADNLTLTPEEKRAGFDPAHDPQAFKRAWIKITALAAVRAQEKNARLGLDSYGTVNGRPAVRKPSGEIKFTKE